MNRDLEIPGLAQAQSRPSATAPPPTIGILVRPEGPGGPRVSIAGGPDEGLACRTCVALTADDCGKSVVLLFEQNDWRRPLVMGVIRDAAATTLSQASPSASPSGALPDRVHVVASRQLVLECGKASLTLTDSGKVLLKGAYVLSSSSGLNRIRGGSVEIN